MKLLQARLLLPLAALLLAACGHIETHHIVFDGSQAPTSGRVEVFIDGVPDRPFSERGLVQAIGYGTDNTTPKALRALQDEARQAGCDAVVKTRVQRGATATHAIGVCVLWFPAN